MTTWRGLLLAAIAMLAFPAGSSATVSCAVSGSALTVSGDNLTSDLALGRSGGQITVTAFVYPQLDPVPIPCSGPVPTVTTIDTVVVSGVVGDRVGPTNLFLEFGTGPLAPGLTPEPDGTSEIELTLNQVSEVIVNGSDGSDTYAFGVLGDSSGANFNTTAEGAAPDLDVLAPAFRDDPRRKRLTTTDWEVHAQGGNDVIDASGGGIFSSGAPAEFRVNGQKGADRILGTPRGSELAGGPGDDLIIGGRKPDAIFGGKGKGRDTLMGRGGKDLLFSGSGRDVISAGRGIDLVYSGRAVDRVRCGPQRGRA